MINFSEIDEFIELLKKEKKLLKIESDDEQSGNFVITENDFLDFFESGSKSIEEVIFFSEVSKHDLISFLEQEVLKSQTAKDSEYINAIKEQVANEPGDLAAIELYMRICGRNVLVKIESELYSALTEKEFDDEYDNEDDVDDEDYMVCSQENDEDYAAVIEKYRAEAEKRTLDLAIFLEKIEPAIDEISRNGDVMTRSVESIILHLKETLADKFKGTDDEKFFNRFYLYKHIIRVKDDYINFRDKSIMKLCVLPSLNEKIARKLVRNNITSPKALSSISRDELVGIIKASGYKRVEGMAERILSEASDYITKI